MVVTNLDMDVLRSFVTGIDLGSYAKAASRLNRSPSAISLQLRKLEEQVGRSLFAKQGRGLALTEAGEALLGHARRILEMNDAAVIALRDDSVSGEVRIGLPQDVAETRFPEVLARFGRLYPNVRIMARVDRRVPLRAAFDSGDLDLLLAWEKDDEANDPLVSGVPIVWIGRRVGSSLGQARPLSLAMFEAPCLFRREAIAALDHAGIPWRISFLSPSLSGLWAAVAGGVGISARVAFGLPQTLAPIENAELPQLPKLSLSLLQTSTPSDTAQCRLAATVRETIAEGLQPPT